MYIKSIVSNLLGRDGTLIAASKTRYMNANRSHMIVFNSNVATKSGGKIWFGDLDLTLSKDKLISLSTELGETVYVFSEHDMRFENESKTVDEIIKSTTDYYYEISTFINRIGT